MRIGSATAARAIGMLAGALGALIAECAVGVAHAQPSPAAEFASTAPSHRVRLPKVRPPRVRRPRTVIVRKPETERIASFVGDVSVAADGRLTVHETIRVVSTGRDIRHGIFRDLPAYDRDTHGQRSRLRLEILSVKRNNVDEPYTLEILSHAWRIRIGDPDIVITKGPHAYEIVYRTNPRIGFSDDSDELYWNVTGNAWRFPIEQTVATITFPANAHVIDAAAYTGVVGTRDQHAVIDAPPDSLVIMRTTRALKPGEGLTVRVGIAKGAIAEPDAIDAFSQFLYDNKDTAAVLIGLVLLIAYYYIAWMLIGRDPRGGSVAPLYEPPRGISPAGMRYIMRMGYDRKAFAATLVSLAVKHVLSVRDAPKLFQRTFTLVRTRGEAPARLSPSEGAVAIILFSEGPEVELSSDSQPVIARTITVLKHALENEFERAYFVTNGAWFALGISILVLSAIAAALYSDSAGDTALVFLLSAFAGLFAGQFGVRAVRHWSAVLTRHGSRLFEFMRAIWWTAGLVPALVAVVGFMFFTSDAMSPYTVAALFAQGFVACVFYELLKAPTAAGAKLRAEIKGFRMFLEMTEKERLEQAHPVYVTPEVFEKYLPYAIALDCENAWGRRFETEVGMASMEAMRAAYRPIWYSGAYTGGGHFAEFANDLGSGLGNAAATATVTGRFSGVGSGSGSSGGGGGGGGGGW